MATWPASLGNPQFSGYDLETTDPTVRTDMEGGSARVRRRYTAAPDTVSLKFLFDAAQMATFRAFWDYDIINGAAWVYMPVKTGYVSSLENRECRPVNGKFKSVPVSATHWLVEFQVEVRRGVYVWYDTINAMKLPSLELDFAGTQSLNSVITSSAQPVVSVEFSRSSVGTYFRSDGLIKTAAADEPRFDFDPITHVCKGLLIEEARTNLLTYSEQFDNAAWARYASLLAANVTTAPDGTLTADKLIENATANTHFTNSASGVSVTAGGVYTLSLFCKAAERSYVQLRCGASSQFRAIFSLADGSISDLAGATAAAQYVGSGWWRLSITLTADASPLGLRVGIAIDSTTNSYTGDGVSGIYLWGAQLEAGAFPTSYIPTTTAQATRAADIAQMTGANFSSWYRQDEGTFVAECAFLTTSPSKHIFNVSDGTNSSFIAIRSNPSTETASRFTVTADGIPQAEISFGGAAVGGVVSKHAFGYKANDFAASSNGAVPIIDTSGSVIVASQARIGATPPGTTSSLHIASLSYYPKRLSNAELQALSA